MVYTLYGEAENERALDMDRNQRASYAKARFKERMHARRELKALEGSKTEKRELLGGTEKKSDS